MSTDETRAQAQTYYLQGNASRKQQHWAEALNAYVAGIGMEWAIMLGSELAGINCADAQYNADKMQRYILQGIQLER